MEHPGPPTKDEIPSRKFGVFVEPTLERKVGIRQEEFTDKEKETSQIVTMRSDAARISVVENENEFEHDADNRESQLSAGTESVGHTGTESDLDTFSVGSSRHSLSSRSSSKCASSESSRQFECTRL